MLIIRDAGRMANLGIETPSTTLEAKIVQLLSINSSPIELSSLEEAKFDSVKIKIHIGSNL